MSKLSKFPKQIWDKMTISLTESFNTWLKNERHHSICTFLMVHMIKLGGMHKDESLNWKGAIGPKIVEKVKGNISKGEGYLVSPFMDSMFGVSIGKAYVLWIW